MLGVGKGIAQFDAIEPFDIVNFSTSHFGCSVCSLCAVARAACVL